MSLSASTAVNHGISSILLASKSGDIAKWLMCIYRWKLCYRHNLTIGKSAHTCLIPAIGLCNILGMNFGLPFWSSLHICPSYNQILACSNAERYNHFPARTKCILHESRPRHSQTVRFLIRSRRWWCRRDLSLLAGATLRTICSQRIRKVFFSCLI